MARRIGRIWSSERFSIPGWWSSLWRPGLWRFPFNWKNHFKQCLPRQRSDLFFMTWQCHPFCESKSHNFRQRSLNGLGSAIDFWNLSPLSWANQLCEPLECRLSSNVNSSVLLRGRSSSSLVSLMAFFKCKLEFFAQRQ